ncbi:cation transporter HKT1;3-like [Actinidia eriantha]|uniref:cation transporter HKT1;3-like n=1 Tax=Actinidia eriantha TaxID=165200 RepID=UPI00258E7983|nr:cation transporter HKT1;3-like [Actinidia eriantha]
MKNFVCSRNKHQNIFSCFWKPTSFLFSLYRYVVLHVHPFLIQLLYFFSVSFLGFWVLRVLKPRTHDSFRPGNLDLFFASVSASTVSSMTVIEMEVFSNTQLIVLTILMFIGGEIFTSMVGLYFTNSRLKHGGRKKIETIKDSTSRSPSLSNPPSLENSNSIELQNEIESSDSEYLKYDSIKFLGLLVLGYFLVIQIVGIVFFVVYLTLVSSAKNVLKRKGIKVLTFSIFTIVSTFASCGFVPTNENMIVFSKNSGLLLLLIPQILLGNTLFPSCLRFLIWVLGKFVKKLETNSNYLLKNTREIGYLHLLPSLHSSFLVITVLGFILLQFILFCSLEWNSSALGGLNTYQRVVGVLFQNVNSRHTGETIVDLSTLSPAILVLFVVMMYLPPYTSFLPIKDDGKERKKKSGGQIVENLIFSQLSYLAIFIILVCITERKKMKEDPLNFNVLNIVVEVISAYGNVGFSMGYSCARQLNPDGNCQDKWFGFSGKWSDHGKIILILVMFFGRLKKFNMDGGRAWKLL